MADDKDFVAKLSRSKLEEIAKEIRTIEDHAERMEHTVKTALGYLKSGKIEAEHRAPAMEMQNPEGGYKDMWDKLYAPLDNDHKKKGSDLEASVTEEWMYKFADKIMPAMKAGVEGEKAHNYEVMVDYLNKFDAMVRHEEPGATKKKVEELIAKGHGTEATAAIIEAIRGVKKHQDYQMFLKHLFPQTKEGKPYIAHVAKHIANQARNYIKEQGAEDKIDVNETKIQEDIINYFTQYSAGNIQYVIQKAKIDKEKKK